MLLLPILSPILIDPGLTGAPIDYTLSMEALLSVWYFIPAIIVVALALGVKFIVRIRKACRYGELMNLNGLLIFGLVVMPDVFTFLIGSSSKYQWKKNTLLL
jgi:predicted membrane protein